MPATTVTKRELPEAFAWVENTRLFFAKHHLQGLLDTCLDSELTAHWCSVLGAVPGQGQEYSAAEFPLSDTGMLLIVTDNEDLDSEVFCLDCEAVKRGAELLGRDYPAHTLDAICGGADAETADVFLQLCCFGRVVYG